MHGIAGRRDEIEAFVEGPRLIILGVDGEGPKAGDLGRRECPGERVLQKTGPDPLAGPAAGDREAARIIRGIGCRTTPLRNRSGASSWCTSP